MGEQIDKIGQYWRYAFEGPKKGAVVYYYAFREEDARAQLDEQFGDRLNADTAKLISRDPW